MPSLLDDIKSVATINGHEVMQEGIKFLKIQSIGADFHLGKSRFKIRDLINGRNLLGENYIFIKKNLKSYCFESSLRYPPTMPCFR